MFMKICDSWLFFSCNGSLRNVTVYRATPRHQSVLTKVRSEKKTTKSERRGNNRNKTNRHRELSSTTLQNGQQVKIHTGAMEQLRPRGGHPLLLTLGMYKHRYTTRAQSLKPGIHTWMRDLTADQTAVKNVA